MSEVAETATTMTEETIDKRARDRARLKKAATWHGAAALAAITLWGAGDMWAAQSGWLLALLVSLLNAIFAGSVLAYIGHEWGHFSGARLSSARSPVMASPNGAFMFGFDMKRNSLNQFLAMSAGGPIANWTLALVVLLTLPMDTLPQAMLLATVTAIAVNVSVFELPVIRDAMSGEDPAATIEQRLKDTRETGRLPGVLVGAAVFLLFAL